MGQEESRAAHPMPVGAGDWRYTIRNLALERRLVTINQAQYQFGKELGSGAFGSVYAAKNIPENKKVAIKVVSLVTMSSGEAEMQAQSILTEIEMSKRLESTSKHTIHLYDFDFHRQSGLAFLVMELGEKDLKKFLSERPRLSATERKDFWRQLVSMATTLHDYHIVHLDIKPENLIVFPGNRLKLADLGIAQKAYKQRIGRNGTYPYSAPEVTTATYSHATMNTSKADAWSWGAVLYRMTYEIPPDYTPPCHHPPKHRQASRDSSLVDVLRNTLVIDPKARADAPWLARHLYTTSP